MVAFPDLDSTPRTHMAAHNIPAVPGDPVPSSGFHGHCIYMPETTHTHKIKIKFQKKNRIFSMLVKRKHDFLKYFHGKQSIMAHPCKLNN